MSLLSCSLLCLLATTFALTTGGNFGCLSFVVCIMVLPIMIQMLHCTCLIILCCYIIIKVVLLGKLMMVMILMGMMITCW